MPPLARKISKPIKVMARPLQSLTHMISAKVNAFQASRNAAKILKKRLPYTNLNIPEYSEVTIYTQSHPSGINANIRPRGKAGRPDLSKVNEKLNARVARRDFYYEHQENCRCSTALSLEENLVRDTKRVCKMTATVTQVETIVEVEDMEAGQDIRRYSMLSQADTVSILEEGEWEETQTFLR